MATTSSRRLRAFKRWMAVNGIACSDALEVVDGEAGIFVRSRCDLKVGEVVATIPKLACLTIKTSGARDLIESAGLDGVLALSVALMYERSLGSTSQWAAYLNLLPLSEPLPLVWTMDEVDSLLFATELHTTVKEDKALIYSDWKECILPHIDSLPSHIDPKFFAAEQYFGAKSLVASRSFAIDDFHGSGMVPLADLFNHKTGAEHVHFTSTPSNRDDESAGDEDDSNEDRDIDADEIDTTEVTETDDENDTIEPHDEINTTENSDPLVLEMILVKDVKVGEEVFNTYGLVGNAALLHRYGFTEPDNAYDIVNIDFSIVSEWASSAFSARHTRARTSLWRRLGYSGCISENSEYFEISCNGEPQVELLILLYIILLPDEAYNKLDLAVSNNGSSHESLIDHLSCPGKISKRKALEISCEMLLTKTVRKALVQLANARESLYGLESFEDDVEILRNTCCIRERKLYHSLMLRISERRILEKLRSYAKNNALPASNGRTSGRKKLKSR